MKSIQAAVAALAALVGFLALRADLIGKLTAPSASSDDTYRPPPQYYPNFTTRDNISSIDEIKPLWSCKSPHGNNTVSGGTKKKLGFIHVFKAAGSTLGMLLQSYAERCHAGYGRLVACNSVSPDSLRSSSRTGKNWKNCTLKKAMHRDGTYHEADYTRRVNNSYLSQNLDVVGGHYSLGSLDYLNDADDIQYLTFVRDAAAKYVSACIFMAFKKAQVLTAEDVYSSIRGQLMRSVQRGEYHFKYKSYLLTPKQKEDLKWSFGSKTGSKRYLDQATEMMKQNLVQYNVIVGSVERISESLEIISHLIDPDLDAEDIFVEYGMHRRAGGSLEGKGKQNEGIRHNKSPISATTMLKYLRKDANFSALLDEHVKYEQQITDFGVELHLKQYDSLRTERMKKSRSVQL